MHTGETEWDVDLIRDVFEERDVELILSIPLQSNVKDTWYWRYEKMGFYSVKSAYLSIQKAKTSLSMTDNSGFWRKLWQLKLPSKVKHFLWRAVTGCLPTKDLLRARRVNVNALCPICNEGPESVMHALVSCSFADHCHKLVRSSFSLTAQSTVASFADWLQSLFDYRQMEETYIHATLCWIIWKNRNDSIWKQRSQDSLEIVNSTLSFLNQWKSVQDKNYDSFLGFMTPEDGQEQWHLPTENSVKINIDAAIFEDPRRYSYAFIIRDHHGTLVEAISKCSPGRVTPEFAEALGIREALSWMKQKHLSNVVLETDCLQVVQLIRSSFSSISYLGKIIEECKSFLSDLCVQNVVLRFVRRSANRVAHYLARYSCSIADRSWKVGDVHPDFDYVLCKDLMS